MSGVVSWLSGLPAPLVVFLTSMLPILELRFAIPFAHLNYEMVWQEAYFLCVLGNMVPVPFIILLGRQILKVLKKISFFSRLAHKLEEKAAKHAKKIAGYTTAGLILFVAVPWPGTGAWTGALIACLMNMRLRRAVPTILAGVLIAGLIMSGLTYGFFQAFGL